MRDDEWTGDERVPFDFDIRLPACAAYAGTVGKTQMKENPKW